jgi:hypothetical protein
MEYFALRCSKPLTGATHAYVGDLDHARLSIFATVAGDGRDTKGPINSTPATNDVATSTLVASLEARPRIHLVA